jgi:hypothetical protein
MHAAGSNQPALVHLFLSPTNNLLLIAEALVILLIYPHQT